MATFNPYSAEFIERYLNDEVTLEERQNFDEQLVNDPKLLEYFSLFMDIDQAIDQPDVIILRQELQNIYDITSKEWLDEAPMMIADTHKEDIDAAISEFDIMSLRNTLNDLHDLHLDELNSTEIRPNYVPVPKEEVSSLSVSQESETQSVDLLVAEIDQAIIEDDIMDLRNLLQEIGEKTHPVTKTKSLRQRFYKLSSIAAIFLLMLMGGTLWNAMDSPMKPDKAIKNYYEPIYYRAATRGVEINQSQWFTRGYERYLAKDYAGALAFFETEEESGSDMGMEVVTYTGICLFYEGRTEEALEHFNTVIADKDNTYVSDAEWFRVACLLQNKETDEALGLLRQLARLDENDHKDEINKLLKKLE